MATFLSATLRRSVGPTVLARRAIDEETVKRKQGFMSIFRLAILSFLLLLCCDAAGGAVSASSFKRSSDKLSPLLRVRSSEASGRERVTVIVQFDEQS
jgi:hypothetical protein